MKSCCGAGSAKGKKHQTESGNIEPEKREYLPFRLVVVIFLAAVVVGGLLYYIKTGGFSEGDSKTQMQTAVYYPKTGGISDGDTRTAAQAAVIPVSTGNEVTFPESTFADGKARFFDHKTPEGKTVRYFVIKSSDGVIRAAYDACDVCWEAGKGYFQKGDVMVCRNCGRQFLSAKVNVVTGGCNPAALTRTIRGGKVVIPVEALNEGRRFFS